MVHALLTDTLRYAWVSSSMCIKDSDSVPNLIHVGVWIEGAIGIEEDRKCMPLSVANSEVQSINVFLADDLCKQTPLSTRAEFKTVVALVVVERDVPLAWACTKVGKTQSVLDTAPRSHRAGRRR